MNTRNVIIGSTVIVSVVGLGLLAYHFMKNAEPEEETEALKEKESNENTIETRSGIAKLFAAKSKTRAASSKPIVLKKEEAPAIKNKVVKSPVKPPTIRPARPLGIPLRGPIPELATIQRPVRPTNSPVRSKPKTSPAPALKVGDAFPLKKGSKGPKVERLNVWLTRNHSWTGPITDEFDNHTERKLKRLTRKSECDERTFKKMRMEKPVFEQKIIR